MSFCFCCLLGCSSISLSVNVQFRIFSFHFFVLSFFVPSEFWYVGLIHSFYIEVFLRVRHGIYVQLTVAPVGTWILGSGLWVGNDIIIFYSQPSRLVFGEWISFLLGTILDLRLACYVRHRLSTRIGLSSLIKLNHRYSSTSCCNQPLSSTKYRKSIW